MFWQFILGLAIYVVLVAALFMKLPATDGTEVTVGEQTASPEPASRTLKSTADNVENRISLKLTASK